MLKQLLVTFILATFCVFTVSAQNTYVLVNTPGSIAGPYGFTDSYTTDIWGVDLTTGTWTADAVVVNDSMDVESDGCTPVLNTVDLTGKIALVDRGDCGFSLKAYHAQQAGAIAVVVINNVGTGLFGMLGGDSVALVTIPAVFVALETGDLIKAELANGPVNMTIGVLSFANDIGAPSSDIIRTPNGTMPYLQSEAAMASLLPGALITNNGSNDATNITLSAEIDYTPLGGGASTNVLTDAVTLDLLQADSAVILTMDNEYVADAGAGTYTVDYAIVSDSTDNFEFDNNQSFSYYLSENVYTKAGWDAANNRPARTLATTIAGGGAIEIISGFQVPLGIGNQIDSVTFYASTNTGTLDDEKALLTAYVYDWVDANDDGAVANTEITIVAIGFIESLSDPTATADWITVQLLDLDSSEPSYIIPEDNKTYFVGVRYDGANTLSLGYDGDYNQFVNNGFIAPTLADLSYFLVNVWDGLLPDIENDAGVFTDFDASISTALFINPLVNSVGENNPEIGTFEVFPNPVSDFVNVETKLAKNYASVDYTIVNTDGRLVSTFSKDISGNVDNTILDVSSLPAGQYFLNVNTTDGSVSKAFTVQR